MDAKPILFAALLTISVAPKGVTAVAAQAGSEQGPWGVIQGYCFGCHNSKARVGGLALDSSSPDHIAEDAKPWAAVIRQLRGGLLPPPVAKHPDGQSVADLVASLDA